MKSMKESKEVTIMKKERFVFTIVLFSVVLVFGLGQTVFSEEPIILKYSDPGVAKMARPKAAQDTMKEIERRTGGRVKHEFYWSQSLLKSPDNFMGVKKGTCDLAFTIALIYHKNRVPIWQFSQLLFTGGPDQYGVQRALNELYDTNPILKKEFDDSGVQLLTTNALTPTIIINKAPLREAKDFKGQRIRSLGAVAKLVAAMGGIPNPMKFYEVPEALARGVLDGTQSYIYASHSYKHYDYCKYCLMTPVSHIPSDYTMCPDTLKKMPPDVRKIYLDTWRDFYLERLVKHTDEEREMHLADFKKAGVTMYTLTPEQLAEWKKVAEPINEEYYKEMEKKGIDGKKIVEQYQALYDKYERK